MRIIYDLQALTMQKTGGVSRYFYELIRRVPRLADVSVSLGGRYARSAHFLSDRDIVERHGLRPMDEARSPIDVNRLRRLLGMRRPAHPAIVRNGRILRRALAANGFDLYHPTYYDAAPSGVVPCVVTVHDMIHERFRRRFPAYDDDTLVHKKRSVAGARKVIVVSESTKRDVMEFLGVPEERIAVTHLASSLRAPAESETSDCAVGRPYILFVGGRSTYKNFLFFLHSVTAVLRAHEDLVILCAGGGEWSREERAVLAAFDVTERVLLFPFVTDGELARCYRGALFFVFPSLYEGFGIPVLEAFECDCPVAASDRSSLPEVAADAAVYFDPEDEESIAGVVTRLIEDSDLRARLREAGKARARQFSWDRTARQTLEVYREARG